MKASGSDSSDSHTTNVTATQVQPTTQPAGSSLSSSPSPGDGHNEPTITPTPPSSAAEHESGEEEEETSSGGAFNPETGEINWDCPCLGGMAYGPCGQQFREAFSCFVYSDKEPKGIDCVEKFKAMQNCFREHPDIYGEGMAYI